MLDIVNPAPQKAIVLVDDERSYTDLMSQMLAENLDCTVHAFTRPLEALRVLPQLTPAVVVTDYYMPQLTGLELIVRARALNPGLPFLIITGHGMHLSEEDFSHLPELRAVLHKPLGWRQLADAIVTHWPRASRVVKTEAGAGVFLP